MWQSGSNHGTAKFAINSDSWQGNVISQPHCGELMKWKSENGNLVAETAAQFSRGLGGHLSGAIEMGSNSPSTWSLGMRNARTSGNLGWRVYRHFYKSSR